MMFKRVDFPQPDAPTMHAKWESGISTVTSSSARTSPFRVGNTIETLRATIELIG
jgi:hypothetical protein